MNLSRKQINYFTCFLLILLLILILICRNDFNSREQLYIILVIILLIIISCLLDNYFDIYKFIKNMFSNKEDFTNIRDSFGKDKVCHNISKDSKGYNKEINYRLDKFREIEEKDRMNIAYDDEGRKLGKLKDFNNEYLVNGELF